MSAALDPPQSGGGAAPLTDLIRRQIAATGPITVADYMALALLHPDHGYYTTADPIGARGDFITAPEISQIFGEMLGAALVQAWLDQGAPSPCALAELGPGRGTLMADILRVADRVPGFAEARQLHLVEVSPVLRAAQEAQLPPATWHDTAAALPDLPLFLVANEFFDALPIRQFLRDGDGWRERVVGLQDGALAFGLTDPARHGALAHRLADTAEGDMVALCSALPPIAAEIGRRIAEHGGMALILDYGSGSPTGDTFQAVRAHERTDPLDAPGTADLTAHVAFDEIARAAAPAAAAALTPQGVFLERLGITERARTLARRLSGAALDTHIAAHRRLTHPEEMGELFKVLGLYPPGGPLPPGLDP